MKLKRRVPNLDAVPKEFQGLYTKDEDEGDFVLTSVEEDESQKGKLKEFREKNIELKKKLEELGEKFKPFEAIDPKALVGLMELQKKIDTDEDTKLIKDGKIEDVIKKRVETMKSDFDKQLAAAKKLLAEEQEVRKTLSTELGLHNIDGRIKSSLAALKVKIREGAEEDVLSRTRQVFRLDEKGKPHPINPDGSVRTGKDAEELTFDEWGQQLVEGAPHLFESSGGGGSGGSEKGKGGGRVIDVDNPLDFGRNLEKLAKGEAIAK